MSKDIFTSDQIVKLCSCATKALSVVPDNGCLIVLENLLFNLSPQFGTNIIKRKNEDVENTSC